MEPPYGTVGEISFGKFCSCQVHDLIHRISCSIIEKASNALEVLKEVIDAVDARHPEVCQ